MSVNGAKPGRALPVGAVGAPVLVGLLVCLTLSLALNTALLYVPSLTPFGRNLVSSLVLPIVIGLPLLSYATLLSRKVSGLRNRLNRLMIHDGTTALLRPESFAAFVDRRSQSDGPTDNAKGALLLIRLENFQSTQLQFGFAWAASIEKAAADCIRVSVRSGDIVGGFGRGQFAVFLPGASEEDALEVGKRVIAGIEKAHWARSGQDRAVNARIAGVWFKRNLPLETTFAAALQELEQASGWNAFTLAPVEARASGRQSAH